jgi:poly(beta-D-mannuronate) lyase
MRFRHSLIVLAIGFVAMFLKAQTEPLPKNDPHPKIEIRNPSASFLNIGARHAELAHATNPRVLEALKWNKSCVNADQPAPPPGRMVIPHHYLSGSNGPVNPEEGKATLPYRNLNDVVSDGAARYVATGDSAEAVCVANLLGRWAAAGTLLDYSYSESSQAWYQVEWTLSSVSLAWSVVQSDPAIPAAQRDQISKWMHRVAEYMFDQDPHPGDTAHENNHAYWRALCATSVGILTSDEMLYHRGLAQYARAIGQMNADGSFPLEMARHENALHYQSFALAPLVMIAELAAQQGTDIYSVNANGHTIADAVNFLVRASADPQLVKKYATEPQTFSLFSGEKPPAWIEFWAARHPGKLLPANSLPVNSLPVESWSDLLTAPLYDATIGGDTTIYAAPARAK